jgi:prepilin-type processing-associated H-X9-DG protein/prepilin-type N-terminal cleavage/methylation domain-containing protein
MKKFLPSKQAMAESRRLSFTLIELLVVIAIISILAALLTPAISQAKQRVNDVKCGQNMRQIQMAIVMYADDNKNTYMNPIGFNTQYLQLTYFSNIITTPAFYRCPASRGDTAPGTPTWDWWHPPGDNTRWTEYKLNDSAGLVGKPLDGVKRPQKLVLVIDGIDWNPRHQGRNNLCFFDGHVEIMTWAQYDGVEPGRESIGTPVNWFNWGIND